VAGLYGTDFLARHQRVKKLLALIKACKEVVGFDQLSKLLIGSQFQIK